MGKLTKPQHDMLSSIRWGGRYHLSTTPTGKALVRKQLAKVNSFGVLSITSAGLAALAEGGE